MHREDPDKGPPAAAALAKEHGGWVSAMNGESVTLRVPDEALDEVMDALPSLGEVAGRRVRAMDVTDAHADLATRIDNLQKSRERYMALLEKAQNVSDAAAVEREIERVTEQLELLQRQLETMEGRVQFAELSVSFSRKARPGPVGWVLYAVYSGVKWLFVWD